MAHTSDESHKTILLPALCVRARARTITEIKMLNDVDDDRSFHSGFFDLVPCVLCVRQVPAEHQPNTRRTRRFISFNKQFVCCFFSSFDSLLTSHTTYIFCFVGSCCVPQNEITNTESNNYYKREQNSTHKTKHETKEMEK